MRGNADLDFAYKYPFSNEAKSIIDGLKITQVEQRYLRASKGQIDMALAEGISYKGTIMADVKTGYLITYAYSRMLVSAAKNAQLIERYAAAEAKRSAQALEDSDSDEMPRLAKELGMDAEPLYFNKDVAAGGPILSVGLSSFMKYSTKIKGLELVNQKLGSGRVLLAQNNAIRLLEEAMKMEILKGLPISSNLLPKEVVEFSKGAGFNVAVLAPRIAYSKADTWVDKLLQTPIPDIRHRTVNLILAPYLVNSKGMSVDQATKIISEYIDRCKLLDPATRINERYIRYQCDYAKKRGLKTLSLDRAKELLGGTIDVSVFS
jgi:DNA primase large subunit